jgi:hypothetical protein
LAFLLQEKSCERIPYQESYNQQFKTSLKELVSQTLFGLLNPLVINNTFTEYRRDDILLKITTYTVKIQTEGKIVSFCK